MTIRERLFALRDLDFLAFQASLNPAVDVEAMIGVRTPALRALAKELLGSEAAEAFLAELPHRYFEENQLHAFLVSEIRDYDCALAQVQRFLPYIDNWATCDQFSPKVFKKYPERLLPEIEPWLSSEKTYTVRFGIGMMMQHYLDQNFQSEYLMRISRIRSGEYYVNMMLAWYFATALAKQWSSAVVCLEEKRLDVWVHNKTIQKARESRRITPEQKEYLKLLKR